MPHAQAVREATGIPTIAVGLIFDPQAAEAIVATGEADLVALGREALNDPNWPLHALSALADSPDPYAAWPKQAAYAIRGRARVLESLAQVAGNIPAQEKGRLRRGGLFRAREDAR